MEIRRGTASKVRFSTEVSGSSGQNGGGVSTTYLAIFELAGVVVHATASRPPTIEDGNEIIAAGKMRDGVFDAQALRNLTRGTVDHKAWLAGFLVSIIFLIVGIAWSLGFLASRSDQPFAIIGAIVAFIGVAGLRTYNSVRAAEAAVRVTC
jgi:hypothetical protein